MSLREKQSLFARKIAVLIQVAFEMGFEVTCGDFYRDSRCPYGHKKSLHQRRLAADLNLFKEGKYLISTKDYESLGLIWEQMGGAWGGRFNDGNHFSLEHQSIN